MVEVIHSNSKNEVKGQSACMAMNLSNSCWFHSVIKSMMGKMQGSACVLEHTQCTQSQEERKYTGRTLYTYTRDSTISLTREQSFSTPSNMSS